MSRLLKNKKNQITQKYKKGIHNGIDIVAYKNTTDYILAHSDGTITGYKSNFSTNTYGGTIRHYGNWVEIKHKSGYSTLYAHLKYKSVKVKTGDKVKKGDVIAYMGNTGYSSGAHLHFEVYKNNSKIDPTPYINKDLPSQNTSSYGFIANKYLKINTKKVNNKEGLNLRKSFTIKSASLEVIPYNKEVTIIKENAKKDNDYIWDKVKYNNKIGYVANKYLTTYKKIVSNRVNIRKEPSVTSAIIKALPKNTIIIINKENVKINNNYTWDEIKL